MGTVGLPGCRQSLDSTLGTASYKGFFYLACKEGLFSVTSFNLDRGCVTMSPCSLGRRLREAPDLSSL